MQPLQTLNEPGLLGHVWGLGFRAFGREEIWWMAFPFEALSGFKVGTLIINRLPL